MVLIPKSLYDKKCTEKESIKPASTPKSTVPTPIKQQDPVPIPTKIPRSLASKTPPEYASIITSISENPRFSLSLNGSIIIDNQDTNLLVTEFIKTLKSDRRKPHPIIQTLVDELQVDPQLIQNRYVKSRSDKQWTTFSF